MKTIRRHLAYFLAGVLAFVLFVNLLPEASYAHIEMNSVETTYAFIRNWYAEVRSIEDIVKIWPYLFGGCVWLLLALLDPAKRIEADQA
jgi:hypothetical protein